MMTKRTAKMNSVAFAPSRPITRSMRRGVRASTNNPMTSRRPSRQLQSMPVARAASGPPEKRLIGDLHTRIANEATEKYKKWIDRYMRGAIPMRGVRSLDVLRIFKTWYKENEEGILEVDTEVMLRELMGSKYAEDKYCGGCYLDEIPKDRLRLELLQIIKELFDDDLIYSWGTTDSFCMRGLKRFVKVHGDAAVEEIQQWKTARNLWRARASVVGLLSLAGVDKYKDTIWKNCEVLIQREERFAKTAVGWMCREISRKGDDEFVRSFLEEHMIYMSIEAMKNASKYWSAAEKKKIMDMLKEAKRYYKTSSVDEISSKKRGG